MKRPRVLFGTTSSPAYLKSMHDVATHLDIEIVGAGGGLVDLLLKVTDLNVDAIILPVEELDMEPGACSHLLLEFPNLIIVTVTLDTEGANLYRSSICKTTLNDGSCDTILKAIIAASDPQFLEC